MSGESEYRLLLVVALGVLAAETLDTAGGVQHLLFTGEEGMAGGADFHVDIALMGRAGGERVTARAKNAYFVVSWVNCSLHSSLWTSIAKR
jgi:hypothetical protein